jgi:hypothetical protein
MSSIDTLGAIVILGAVVYVWRRKVTDKRRRQPNESSKFVDWNVMPTRNSALPFSGSWYNPDEYRRRNRDMTLFRGPMWF